MSAPVLNKLLGESPETRRGVLVSVGVTLACLLPFIAKAFHIDDTMYLWAAQQIQQHPLDFYGFDVLWGDTYRPMHFHNQNPPLVSYYLALAGAVTGWNEIGIHLFLLLPAVASAAGMYCLARRFSSTPVLATLLAVFTPVYLVSNTNVMADGLLLAFYVWAIEFWMRGMEGDLDDAKWDYLHFASACIALGFLTKYFALSLIPLLAVYALMVKRSPKGWWKAFIAPIVVAILFDLWTRNLYGKSLLLGAGASAGATRSDLGIDLFQKGLTGLSFVGGLHVVALFFMPLLWSKRLLGVWVAVFACAAILLSQLSQFGSVEVAGEAGEKWPLIIEGALFIAIGLQILVLTGQDLWKHRDAKGVLLSAWIVGTLGFSVYLNWSVTARTILPMTPAVALVLARRLEPLELMTLKQWKWATPLALSALAALSIAWADYAWAGSQRSVAERYHDELEDYPGEIIFMGHWGWQWHMEKLGARPRDIALDRANPGDVIIIPRNNIKSEAPPDSVVSSVHLSFVDPSPWIATMQHAMGAGFYADVWGPLPYAIGPVPEEKYTLYVIGAPGQPLPGSIPVNDWFGEAINPADHEPP